MYKRNEKCNKQKKRYNNDCTCYYYDNVETSMIWGCQWDATLRWMQTSTDSSVASFPTNSAGKGNYKDTNGNKPIPTGSNTAYAVNNIYDMAGNVYDWTIEAGNTNNRFVRGGYCNVAASSYSVSNRIIGYPNYSAGYVGCRATLYINL